MNHLEEMKLAAELVQHEDFMKLCESGFPLVAFEGHCQFCGAAHFEKCKRRNVADMTKDRKSKA